ncbi:SUKH-4 family immunity protein [Nonomuraea glycinis]|uniref:SUKH-4 family immunity protein n=1 Tax=Nonomuraea glycinis TaxID=2047744 RepID=UPI0033AD248C
MVTHEELVEAFGDDGLLLMDPARLHGTGVSAADTHLLCQVGLPVRVDPAFTTLVTGEPAVGSLVEFRAGAVLVLGGTPGDAGMRYFLDPRSGAVGLLTFDDEPHAEQVNSSLGHFVEFLLRLGSATVEELKALDPGAFGDAEAWWPMVLVRRITERRADRDRFERALGRLADEGWQIVDAERFAADTGTSGLLSPAVGDHFTPDGALVKDVALAWRGGLSSRIQSLFAWEGLVLSVPGQAERHADHDALLEMDADELSEQADAAMDALFAAVHGLAKAEEGIVTCLATDRASDLCRIVGVFGRLVARGYVAEPDLWPTSSGGWQTVHDLTPAGEPPRALFWTTQAHTSCFDARGDLVDDLALEWAGDRDLIAAILAETGLVVRVPETADSAFLLRPAGRAGLT